MKRILLSIGMTFAVVSCFAATEQLFDSKQALTVAGREYIESIFTEDGRRELVYELIMNTFMSECPLIADMKLRDVIVTSRAVYTFNKKDDEYRCAVKSGASVEGCRIRSTLFSFLFPTDVSIEFTEEWFNDTWEILIVRSSYRFDYVAQALQIGVNNIELDRPGCSPATVTEELSPHEVYVQYTKQLRKAVQAMIECAWYMRTLARDPEIIALRAKKVAVAPAVHTLSVVRAFERNHGNVRQRALSSVVSLSRVGQKKFFARHKQA